ncbi:MAG TPA: type IV toxin-antitoxin system AbiEi family antitoxin domain-containing protein [Puia sp.]
MVKKHDWGVTVDYHQASFLPSDIGLTEVELKNFSIKVSGPVRAIMECLNIAPLAKAFNTSAEFWLHSQENYDLAHARKKTSVKDVRVFWKHRPAI